MTALLYRGNALTKPEPKTKSDYQYPPNSYTGKVRFDRIDEAIEWAEQERAKGPDSHWHQNSWAILMTHLDNRNAPQNPEDELCKTALCLAGHAATAAGYTPVILIQALKEEFDTDYFATPREGYVEGDTPSRLNHRVRTASAIAKEWFGASSEDNSAQYVQMMFDGSNDIGRIKLLRDRLANAVGFPTRWERPATPETTKARSFAGKIQRASNLLDLLATKGQLVGEVNPDELLAEFYEIDLQKLADEKAAIEAWDAKQAAPAA